MLPDPADPDNQEQALFEQRLCDDIYGVAVRKINQNGKSNLRYVKCLYIDAPEVLHFDDTNSQHFSSSKSVSSRHSRGSRVSLPRFLGGGSSHSHSHRNSGSSRSLLGGDNDAHRSLLRENKSNVTEDSSSSNNITSNIQNQSNIRVLSWGKKKDVTVPLDIFTAVRKGKVNDRSRRNHSNSSRILSLVTSDIHDIHSTNENSNNNSVSLDIEAPTRLDRDKFAKAFARFLNVPLIEEDEIIRAKPSLLQSQSQQAYVSTAFPNQQKNHRPLSPQPQGNTGTGTNDGNRSVARSIKSDVTPLSWRGENPHRQSVTSSVANDNYNNDNSIPDLGFATSNSQTTGQTNPQPRSSSWKQINAPLPVVTTSTRRISNSSAGNKNSASTKPPRNNRRSTSNPLGGVALVAANAPPIHPGIPVNPKLQNNANINININTTNNVNNINGSSSRTGSEADDPPLASLPSSTRSRGDSNSNNNNNNRNTITSSSALHKKEKMILNIPLTTKSSFSKNSNSNSNHDRGTPATSAISARTTPNTPATDRTSPSFNDVNVNNNVNDSFNANNISRGTTTDDSDSMDGSVVSSITGVGFDQDLVEELHMALEKMKAELEDSRAEASRAVKVAEQAIQSAEHSSSKDWNNTVTHKAAEAAATAQKRSAEAMAKARVAEEKLELERKNALLRTKQVEEAEKQAAHWQTRAAAAEVQRFAVAEALESERKRNQDLVVLPLQALESERKKNEDLMLQAKMAVSGTGSPKRSSGSKAIAPSQSPFSKPKTFTESVEVDRLHSKLAMERARRRKLLDELQDLRGAIRVYCRLKAPPSKKQAAIEMVSNEVLMLNRNNTNASSSSPSTPLCFEFDGILASDMGQQDVYSEFEAICASVLEGFKICVMSYGQANSRKTHTMLGDVHIRVDVDDGRPAVSIENKGIHLRAAKQLFSLLEHRKDRFQDTVTMNLVEVHDEKLIDLLAGTDFGEQHGRVVTRKSSRRSSTEDTKSPPRKPSELKPKLEIKTNRDGETVVRGVLSVDLASFDDVLRVWTESLANRSDRLSEQNVEDPLAYERDSHLVATLKVTSKNRSTGSTAHGKMQFVDFAASDVMTKQRPLGNSGGVSSILSKSSSRSFSEQLQQQDDWKFTNKSLNTVREVVLARSQYQRSVPYRNSTITHILSDSLEADTKVVLIACVSCDKDDLSNTTCTLKLAQEMRKVIVGKATRHTAVDSIGSSSNIYINSNINNSSHSNGNSNSNSNIPLHKIHNPTAAI
jgi:kinesin family protein C2/C3